MAEPAPIEDLWREPAPQRVVLLGKGKSLESYDPQEFTSEVVMGINEVCRTIPCTYTIYIDARQRTYTIPHDVTPIRQDHYAQDHNGRGYVFTAKIKIPPRLRIATASMALGILGLWGVKDIVFVGFDAFDRHCDDAIYADCVDVIQQRGHGDFDRVNEAIRGAIDKWDIRPRWFHRGERFDPCAS